MGRGRGKYELASSRLTGGCAGRGGKRGHGEDMKDGRFGAGGVPIGMITKHWNSV